MDLRHCAQLTALGLVLSVGTASPVLGQELREQPREQARENRAAERTENRAHFFHRASDLIGNDVANPNNDVIASIEDFIVDRGSGRIEHALLKSGDLLGIGGKTIAVPYGRLSFDSVDKRFKLDMTKEQIDRASSFVPANWSELRASTWTQDVDKWWNGDDTDSDITTEHSSAFKSAERRTVKGTIESVERDRSIGGSEQVIVTVRTDNGADERLLLGPSWYVMGQDAAPMRGDKIEAKVVHTGAQAGDGLTVLSAKIDGDDLTLRDDEGRTRWRMDRDSEKDADKSDRRDRKPEKQDRDDTSRKPGQTRYAGRLMLLTDLVGASAITTNKTGGEVQEVVIERRSGQVAFIGFDPNENLLGIADEIKVVPWPLLSVGSDHKVRIDASSEMLKSAEKFPDDVTVYQDSARLGPLYRGFAIQPAVFKARADSDRAIADDGWGKDGFYSKAFIDGEVATVSGRITSIRIDTIRDGTPASRVAVVTTDSGEQSVILGPEWYMAKQSMALSDGSRVIVHGKRGTLNGKSYICAHSIESDGRSLTLWDSDRPAWEGR